MQPTRGGVLGMFQVLYERLLQFLPNFLLALILLGIGLILAKILSAVILKFFRAINVDRFWDRAGVREVLNRGGIREPLSVELSRITFWLVIVVFIIISLNALNLPAVDMVLARFFLYLPNVFIAVVILLVGYLLSNYFARAALIAAVNSGLRRAGLIARLVRLAVFLFSLTMALEQLEIGRISVLLAFAIMFGGIVLSFAIAVGLGAQGIVRDYLERKMNGGKEEDHINHM